MFLNVLTRVQLLKQLLRWGGGGVAFFMNPKTQRELQSLCSHLVFVCVSPTRTERHQMRNAIKVVPERVVFDRYRH